MVPGYNICVCPCTPNHTLHGHDGCLVRWWPVYMLTSKSKNFSLVSLQNLFIVEPTNHLPILYPQCSPPALSLNFYLNIHFLLLKEMKKILKKHHFPNKIEHKQIGIRRSSLHIFQGIFKGTKSRK